MKKHILFLVPLLALVQAPPLWAATTTWTGGTDAWETAPNWSAGLPAAGVDFSISNGGTVTLSNAAAAHLGILGSAIGQSGTLFITTGGSLTLDDELRVGDSDSGTLTLSDGGTISDTYANIAREGGSAGTATMTGGTWTNSAGFVVGNGGTGTFTQTGGDVIAAGFDLGLRTGASGTATLSGGTWTTSGNLNIGANGDGTLDILAGSTVSIGGNVGIASAATSNGTLNFGAYDLANATGAGALDAASIAFGSGTGVINFNQNDDLTLAAALTGKGTLAQRGTGTTTLTGDVTLDAGSATVVNQGTLAVDGADARLALDSGTLTVGADSGDNGNFAIRDGAQVSSSSAYLGSAAGATGSATVTGAGSSWQIANTLAIGYAGTGSLTISDGAVVTSGSGAISGLNYSNGTVTVTGQGSLWESADRIYIGPTGTGVLGTGYYGEGTLTVADGGTVRIAGGSGALVIGGSDQYYAASAGTLNIGNYDLSQATTAGVLDVASIVFGGGQGYINFNQTDAFVFDWHTTAPLDGTYGQSLNQRGSGTTIITGSVSTAYTYVSAGQLIASGPGALLGNVGGGLFMGENSGDNGTLIVRDGATAAIRGGSGSSAFAYIGYNAGTAGTVLVTGEGSLFWGSYLFLGNQGSGTFTLSDGASLVLDQASKLYLGYDYSGRGTLNVGAYDLSAPTTGGTISVSDIIFGGGGGAINFNQTDDLVISANISRGTGYYANTDTTYPVTVNQRGTGTTTLAGTNTYRGATNVSGGTLKVTGSITHTAFNFTVGLNSGDNAHAVIASGASVSDSMGDIGWLAGSTGAVTVENGGTWTNASELRVGDAGSGTLTFSGGTISDTYANLARETGSSGVVTMSDGTWNNSAWFVVGNAGTATFTQTGGDVSATEFDLGLRAGGSGTATLSGGTWTTTGNLNIGNVGSGTLNLLAGSTVSIGGNVVIGSGSGSSGTLNIGAYDLAHATGAGALTASSVKFGTGTGVINFNQTDSFTLSAPISGNGSVYQRGSGTTTLSGTNTYTGATSVSDGTLNVTGSISHTSKNFTIGLYSGDDAHAVIASGASVSDYTGDIGWLAGSAGSVTVEDGATWTNAHNLIVGEAGTGSLTVHGSVSAGGSAYLGDNAGGSGTLTVSGANALLQTTSVIGIGFGAGATGTITVADGGTVRSASAWLGSDAGTTGGATLSGAGTSWTTTGGFYVGNSGDGTLRITDGALLSVGGIVSVGVNAGSTGSIAVDGGDIGIPGASFGLYVGDSGTGTLTFDAGTITGVLGVVGRQAGSSGTVVMNGGVWTNSDELQVGNLGAATFTFSGGTISDTYGNLARATGSSATVAMSGGTWNNSVGFVVGNAGAATFTQTGGTVNSADIFLGYNADGSGTATLSGATTRWAGTGDVMVGYNGSGSLTISGGAQVSGQFGVVARFAGSTGAVVIDGEGSLWQSASAFDIGQEGTGSLTVTGGARAASDNTTYIGLSGGASGTVLVSGAGSSFETALNLRVGQYGAGVFTLADSASVVVGRDVYLGNYEGASGTLNIGAYDLAHATTGGALTVSGIGGVRGVILGATGGTGVINFNQTDAFTLAADISGSGSVVQRGSGTTILTGSNSYAGPTTISAGTLLVNGSLSASSVTVGNGGTLGGTGSLSAVTLESGAVLAPGSSIGTLAASSLTWNPGATLVFDLGTGTSNLLDLSGDLTMGGAGEFAFTFGNAGWQVGETYTLILFGGSTDFAESNFSYTNGGGFDGTFTINDHNVQFTVAAVPEPSAWGLLGVALAAMVFLRRRRAGL